MSREQLSEHQSQGAAPAQADQQGDIQGLPPNLYHQAARIRPGDVQGLRDLLTLFPDFAPQILAVASSSGVGLSTVKQAQAMVQQNVTGQRGTLTSAQIHEGGESAQGSAPVLGPEPAPEAQAAAVDSAKPLSKPEQRQILHDPSDPKALSKPEQVEILNDRTDAFQMTPDHLLASTKVEDARAFNAAHADLVASFNKLTSHACCEQGASGPVDPQAVASWQAARGLDVDGKIGPHTVAAAKAESKHHTEAVAEGESSPQPAAGIPV